MSDSVSERALIAAGRCVAHRGLAATTLEVVAKEAGVGRATLYRYFPNGRQQLFDELIAFEVGRFFAELYNEVEGLETIEDVLERGLRHAHHAVTRHFLLQTILREDPSVLEPSLSIALDSIELRIAEVFTPFLPDTAARDERADFLARMSLDYISTQGRWDVDDPEQLRKLVRGELLAWVSAKPKRVAPAVVRPLRRVRDLSTRGRVIDATIEEIVKGRYNDFTIESIVRRVSISRATVYRAFPGGRDAMISAALDRESARLLASVADAMASQETLHGCVLAGLTTVWRHLGRDRAFSGVLTADPEMIRRRFRFEAAEQTYFLVSSFAQPLLGRWLDPEAAGRSAEWICRIVVSYWLNPSSYLDIVDADSVATFYGRHLAAGIEQFATSSA